jgi:hypothetical protein
MTALRDNRVELVAASIAGRVAPARIHAEAMASDHDGRVRLLPGTGGIALGVHAGDRAANWLADHLMAGASVEDADGTPAVAGPLHLLSCIGNRVRDAAGRGIGIVAGKRGGLAPGFWAPQLVGVEISDAVAARLNPDDRIIVETVGRGLKLLDHPEITLANLSPRLLDALPLTDANGALACAVCALVPPEAAGAGLGQDSWVGDLEITDERSLAGNVADLRFGDLVAFADGLHRHRQPRPRPRARSRHRRHHPAHRPRRAADRLDRAGRHGRHLARLVGKPVGVNPTTFTKNPRPLPKSHVDAVGTPLVATFFIAAVDRRVVR